MTEHTFEEEYSVDVQKKFIGLLVQDKLWAELNGFNIITPELFENRILHNICQWIHTYYKKRKDIPTKLILKEKAKDFTNEGKAKYNDYFLYEQALEDIYLIEGGEAAREEWKEKAVKFVRTIKWKKALENGTSAFDMNNAEQAIEKFKEVLTIGTENDLGIDMSERSIDDFISELGQTYDKSNMIHTGIPSWDAALGGGFVKNNLHIIGGCPGAGKAIDINTLVATMNGWKKAGTLKIGDKVIGSNGKETTIIGVFPQGLKQCFKVTFNDHSFVYCCNEHLWGVYDTQSSKKDILHTLSIDEILNKGLYKSCPESRLKSGRKPAVRWKVPLVKPVEYSEKEYIIHPYNLGVLLGDGCMSSNKASIYLSNPLIDIFIKEKFEKNLPKDKLKLVYSNENRVINNNECPLYTISKINGLHNCYIDELRRLNLMECKSNTKFIPDEYKFGSVKQRIDLLHGLMDTDGSSHSGNKISYSTTSEQLAKDIVELVQSLGGMSYYKKIVRNPRESHNYKEEIYYSVNVKLNTICPFSLERKAKNWNSTNKGKYISNIEEVEPREQVCFKVDAEDELFVIENYIVTHNSKTMAYLAKQALMESKKVIFITLELDEVETEANLRTAYTGISFFEMLNPENREEFIKKTEMFKNTFSQDCLIKFYKPSTVTADTIYNYIQKVIQYKKEKFNIDWKPDVIFLDYLDKLLPTQKVKGSLYEDIGGVADDCKNLAITFNCPVITGSQLGRATWNIKGSEVISLDSLAESARKAHLAHTITTVNANPGEKAVCKARLFMAKSRSGKPGTTIYIEQNLGKCLLYEVDPWDPDTLQGTVNYSFKSSAGGNK